MLEILFADKTIKLWKVSERDKKAEGYNLKEDSGLLRDPSTINTLRVSESSFLSSAADDDDLHDYWRPLRGVAFITWPSSKLSLTMLQCPLFFKVPVLKPMELMVEASPRRIFANAHTYHINSISINSDAETYLSADDLR